MTNSPQETWSSKHVFWRSTGRFSVLLIWLAGLHFQKINNIFKNNFIISVSISYMETLQAIYNKSTLHALSPDQMSTQEANTWSTTRQPSYKACLAHSPPSLTTLQTGRHSKIRLCQPLFSEVTIQVPNLNIRTSLQHTWSVWPCALA